MDCVPVDERMVRPDGNAKHVGIAVLERAREVVVDLAEAESQLALRRPCLRCQD